MLDISWDKKWFKTLGGFEKKINIGDFSKSFSLSKTHIMSLTFFSLSLSVSLSLPHGMVIYLSPCISVFPLSVTQAISHTQCFFLLCPTFLTYVSLSFSFTPSLSFSLFLYLFLSLSVYLSPSLSLSLVTEIGFNGRFSGSNI